LDGGGEGAVPVGKKIWTSQLQFHFWFDLGGSVQWRPGKWLWKES
jgi:hypothetical protein